MEPAGLCNRDHLAEFGPLHRPGRRTVHLEASVAAPAVIVLEIVGEQPSQMALAEDDDVAEALAANAADHALGERVLPGGGVQ